MGRQPDGALSRHFPLPKLLKYRRRSSRELTSNLKRFEVVAEISAQFQEV
jgi:hypothetical protein